MTELDKIITDYPSKTTFFQYNFFVLGKEPTIQAKLRRCVDELKTRKQSLEAAYMELEELDDHIILLEIEKQDITDLKRKPVFLRQLDRKIKHDLMKIEEIKSRIKTMEEECAFFMEAFKKISEIEPPKQWDDLDVQLEYWNEKYIREIRERLLLQLPLDVDLIRSALALPDNTNVKMQVVQLLQKQHDKLIPTELDKISKRQIDK